MEGQSFYGQGSTHTWILGSGCISINDRALSTIRGKTPLILSIPTCKPNRMDRMSIPYDLVMRYIWNKSPIMNDVYRELRLKVPFGYKDMKICLCRFAFLEIRIKKECREGI
jgi:hypothetical protein